MAFAGGVPAALAVLMVVAWRDRSEPLAGWGHLLGASVRLATLEAVPVGYLLRLLALRRVRAVALVAVLGLLSATAAGAQQHARARDLGIAPGTLPPGPLNAITDVAGHGSGDYVIAFSTHPGVRRRFRLTRVATSELANDEMTGLFQGVAEATEEAIYNSLFMATTVTASSGAVEALPVADVVRILRAHGVLGGSRPETGETSP
ncbi:MAG: P1 family peptidase [Gemmatimonadales bacterium]